MAASQRIVTIQQAQHGGDLSLVDYPVGECSQPRLFEHLTERHRWIEEDARAQLGWLEVELVTQQVAAQRIGVSTGSSPT